MATGAACSVGDLDLRGLACPCVTGYACDPKTNLCVLGGVGQDGGFVEGGTEAGGFDGGAHDGPPMTDAGDGSPRDTGGGGGEGGDGGDAGSGVLVVTASAGLVTAVAVDTTHVYWATSGPAQILSMPLAGGTIATLATGVQTIDLAVNEAGLYALLGAPPQVSLLTGSGPPKTVWDGSAYAFTTDLAVDTQNVYWGAAPALASTSVILRYGGSGSPVTLASGAFDTRGIAVDATHIYDGANGQILSFPIAGGSSSVFVSDYGDRLALDATGVYAAFDTSPHCNDHYVVTRYPKAGGAPTTLGGGSGSCADLVYDSGWVYCADRDNGLRRLAPVGGSDVVLGGAQAYALAVDSTYVYWADQGIMGGSILKLPK